MKRRLAFLAIVCGLALVGWLGTTAYRMVDERRSVLREREVLPNAELLDLATLPVPLRGRIERSTVIVFFTTTCPYCRTEMDELAANRPAIDDAELVLISPEPVDVLASFVRDVGLEGLPQARVLHDPGAALAHRLGIRTVPTLLVYDRMGRLMEAFEGLTSIERLRSALERAR